MERADISAGEADKGEINPTCKLQVGPIVYLEANVHRYLAY